MILIVSVISGWTSVFTVNWSISKVVCYLGYVLVGDCIREECSINKNNKKAIACFIISIILLLQLTYVQFEHLSRGVSEAEEYASIASNFNPLVAISAILIFIGFSLLSISDNRVMIWLSSKTFLIYLIHAYVVDIINKRLFGGDGMVFDCCHIIPISVIVVFITSLFLAILYEVIWGKIDKDGRVTNRICSIIHL